jgi:hypothetical protein
MVRRQQQGIPIAKARDMEMEMETEKERERGGLAPRVVGRRADSHYAQ